MGFDVKRLDIYRKVPKDLTQPTVTGAVISVCCCSFMLLLLICELWYFVSPEVVSDLFVDNPGDHAERIPVFLKISLPRIKCDYVGLDIQDDQGRHEVGFVNDTQKTPIMEGNGCLFESSFRINKVPGNFHVSTHSASDQPDEIDFAHVIHEVRFGETPRVNVPDSSFNPLAGRQVLDKTAMESHDYVMKIVPTVYEDISGNKVVSYQYTYAYKTYISFSPMGRFIPAIWFKYDLNPITVRYHEKRPPFYTFITTVCAIVGGTFTVAGIIDSAIFTASEMFKKFEIGKLT
ncbi:Endoplasmic reticulum-Golgi intermediate compartment protein 1 [Amphibalanus amphitrite]|uniref:Endoplasmic reticulum-Golgi intermediate compartment protein 1 n=1 Tax=Amphibalanus amphitrite TaxID=1232801 RepID=A0A6A4VJE1_AMPAM|nr:endoplasmic reticulum-Golgi intermediate compartment protein 1-like isoform X2 [Amphibalanus amphitrite]XP_043232219.1 endoplasmic reticulum-Golgi intermediate compartment protein 1-like isoform X2 [Amphibalanus amphitrite]XP_043232220.1 endoplasmic reticulum-Golgi intermediate compartment protein 1-like isoform X2 [Amphibalanus amphitrite]XP_043232221.1 endoplasmic reticulum-Golgi intermediate compartment protein 1-like isoform X2 [Amphibalanus amphitrite]KAF0293723.1 Endoplasmic reticulum-